ncbi:hypothetical protein Thein_1974 [Thermodesulfatator indicus DSM 15286]|uniref:ParB domain protein nuclease n=1 Tax=Thermodesulfatator indicus (strain DSM 15286 / JCM 11887 / CIR29812) TaxID=667014 RepID=F8ACP9_THEID|nr:ParB N-terminal domain-containing protein [Thermodesulfatator indicus]AEH45828.1 hypothetical protein Thein_1974 [Thermodesulfatator indicus DSM 15286]
MIEYPVFYRKLSDLTWDEPERDGVYLLIKESIKKHGQIFMPLLIDPGNRVWDGRKRAEALEELIAGGEGVSKSVPVIVMEDPADLARELNVIRRPPAIEDLLSFTTTEVEKRVPGREELISELLRARGIGPRIFRELIKETKIVVNKR